MKALGSLDPVPSLEGLADSAVSAVSDLTKRAIHSVLDAVVFKPVKAVSKMVIDAIFSIPFIPLSMAGERPERPIAPTELFR